MAGKEPGRPVQTGHIWEFGSSFVSPDEQAQKIFVFVFNCICISMPITGVKVSFVFASDMSVISLI